MRLLKEASERGSVRLVVSRRTLYQLNPKPDDALAFAQRLEVLPYYKIGAWGDFNDASWDQLTGTWENNLENDALQQALPVRKGVDIKDRGIIIDSMQAGILILVTNDKFLLSRADDIQKDTGVRPVTPEEAVKALLWEAAASKLTLRPDAAASETMKRLNAAARRLKRSNPSSFQKG
jgi:hypothetical protein